MEIIKHGTIPTERIQEYEIRCFACGSKLVFDDRDVIDRISPWSNGTVICPVCQQPLNTKHSYCYTG